LIVGDRPGDLLERNYLVLNLSPPSAVSDTSWVKPGKVMRDPTLTTKVSKEIIDFAETAALSYVHLDAGWYGPERDPNSDATLVDPKRVQELDLAEIVRYGEEKGVGVLVYVNGIALKRQLNELLPLYEQWGLKGIKFGFVKVGPQAETQWISDALKQAAGHHLMINIHDGFRATGLQRTYPNLMTVEGIRGNEHMPTAEHNCTLPFTRYVTGCGDYTVCYYNNRIQTTHAHQLAMSVISFSPLQWIFWYDRPDMYHGEPEIEFFREVPTVWDETRVIHGEIGKYATIARRSGNEWFVGTINGSSARNLEIPLSFLSPNKEWIARVYLDDGKVDTRTQVGIKDHIVNNTSMLDAQLVPSGGQAIWIQPKEQNTPSR
jgi:alpha-glucosidase